MSLLWGLAGKRHASLVTFPRCLWSLRSITRRALGTPPWEFPSPQPSLPSPVSTSHLRALAMPSAPPPRHPGPRTLRQPLQIAGVPLPPLGGPLLPHPNPLGLKRPGLPGCSEQII